MVLVISAYFMPSIRPSSMSNWTNSEFHVLAAFHDRCSPWSLEHCRSSHVSLFSTRTNNPKKIGFVIYSRYSFLIFLVALSQFMQNGRAQQAINLLKKFTPPDTERIPWVHICELAHNGHLNFLQEIIGGEILHPSKALTLLHAAIHSGRADIVRLCLPTYPELINQSFPNDATGEKPLLLAAAFDLPEVIDVLVREGHADLSATMSNRSALWYAADGSAPKAVLKLVDLGLFVDIDATFEPERRTALHWAILKERFEVTKFLLFLGADVDHRSKRKAHTTALHIAVDVQLKFLRLLLLYSPQLDCENLQGFTPVEYAFLTERIEHYQILIEAGARIRVETLYKRFSLGGHICGNI